MDIFRILVYIKNVLSSEKIKYVRRKSIFLHEAIKFTRLICYLTGLKIDFIPKLNHALVYLGKKNEFKYLSLKFHEIVFFTAQLHAIPAHIRERVYLVYGIIEDFVLH